VYLNDDCSSNLAPRIARADPGAKTTVTDAAIMKAFHATDQVGGMSEGLLRQYPRSLREDQASVEAAVEISGYGALQALLKSTGEHLSPRVRGYCLYSFYSMVVPHGEMVCR
jgi:hypothetical protein